MLDRCSTFLSTAAHHHHPPAPSPELQTIHRFSQSNWFCDNISPFVLLMENLRNRMSDVITFGINKSPFHRCVWKYRKLEDLSCGVYHEDISTSLPLLGAFSVIVKADGSFAALTQPHEKHGSSHQPLTSVEHNICEQTMPLQLARRQIDLHLFLPVCR